MSGEKEKEQIVWGAYCKKCGKNHGEQWGLHICPDCGGEVDIMEKPPKPAGQKESINLRL